MTRFLLFVFILLTVALATLQFSRIARLEDPALVQLIQDQLLDEFRELSADKFNQSLEKDSFGKILNRAADIFTTRITLLDTAQSRGIKLNPGSRNTVIYTRFLVENSSEEPIEVERYMRYSQLPDGTWEYMGLSDLTDYYINFLTID